MKKLVLLPPSKRINTMSQFLDHLADDVMPALIERLSTENQCFQFRAAEEGTVHEKQRKFVLT